VRRALRIVPLALLLAACGQNTAGAPPPVIDSLVADPTTIVKGGTSTLSWSARNATQFTIDQGIGDVSGTSVLVSPTKTTTYHLTASGAGGTATANVTVTVGTTQSNAPVIAYFVANPTTVFTGGQTTLSWSVTNATSLSIAPNVGTVSGTQITVTVPAAATYTLTATGPGGTATASVNVATRPPVLHLDYLNPAGTAGALRLIKNQNNSTDTRLQLDLVVGAQPVTAFGLAMNLPFDVTRAKLSTNTPFAPGTAINVGSSPAMAVAKVPTAGPLQNVLVLGLAQKQRGVEAQIPAGTVIFSLAFDLIPNAPTGVVFDGVIPGLKFDAALLRANNTRAVDKAGFDIGQMIVAL
jgi:hypothetical protein